MSNRILVITLILSCFTLYGFGQDKIFLINGNKIKGAFIPELSTDTTLYLTIFDRGIHIPYNVIKAARFSKKSKAMGAKKVHAKIYPELPTGMYHRFGIGTLLGSHSYWGDPTFSLHLETVTGYKWSNLKNVGFRLAFDTYEDYLTLPLAIHYELEATRKYTSPMIYGGLGYGFAWMRSDANLEFDKIRGGLHYYAGLGYRFHMEEGKNILVRIGGQSQRVVQEITDPDARESYWGVTYQKRIMRRLTLGVDITF